MPARPASLIASPPFDRVELANAVAYLRGDRPRWHFQRPRNRKRSDFAQEVAQEDALRHELVGLTDHWRALSALTPQQMSVLLAYAIEGNAERAATRLCISQQTVKNHITNIRKRIYGRDYAQVIGCSTSSAPLIALAVRWALDADPRDLLPLETETHPAP